MLIVLAVLNGLIFNINLNNLHTFCRYYGSIYIGYGKGKSRIANWLSVSILKSNQQENCWVWKFVVLTCVCGVKSHEKGSFFADYLLLFHHPQFSIFRIHASHHYHQLHRYAIFVTVELMRHEIYLITYSDIDAINQKIKLIDF